MALKLVNKIKTPYSDSIYVEYWRVGTVTLNHSDQTGTAELLGYISQTQRQAGKSPVDSRSFSWDGSEYPFPLKGYDVKDEKGEVVSHIDGLDEKNPVELTYGAIKTKKATAIKDGREVIIESEFKTAKDI